MFDQFLDNLLQNPVEEGAHRAIAGYDYQIHWAINKAIEFSNANQHYILCFECHEDIIILQDLENKKFIRFIQIKTKNEAKQSNNKWTIGALSKRAQNKTDKSSKHSIIGKLYKNKSTFGEVNDQIEFVSNVYFSFKEDLKQFSFKQIEEKDQQTLTNKLVEEFDQDVDLGTLRFEQSELPITNTEAYIEHALKDLLASKIKDNNFSISLPKALYEHLYKECMTRAKKPISKIKTKQELLAQKSLESNNLNQLLEKYVKYSKKMLTWDDISPYLTCNPITKINIKEQWFVYYTQFILGELDEFYNELFKHVDIKLLSNNIDSIFDASFLNTISKKMENKKSDVELQALLLIGMNNAE